MSISLILGGVKSGKSALAERLASCSQWPVTYIATATAEDDAMQARIEHHQQKRPDHWQTVEVPIKLGEAITAYAQAEQCLLIDCLTLWLTNLLMLEDETRLRDEIDSLLSALNASSGEIILVSNETNMGIMPLGELTRRYCDEIGLLHQAIAQISERVVLTVAGLPHCLKGELNDRA